MNDTNHEANSDQTQFDRCPVCDTRAEPGATICLMCGTPLSVTDSEAAVVTVEPGPGPPQSVRTSEPPIADELTQPGFPDVYPALMRERQAPVTLIMALIFAVVTILVGTYVFRVAAANPVQLALFATATPLPPTPSYTPTITLAPTETGVPTVTPLPTETLRPSATPPPPRVYQVNSGETLFVLGFRFNVSVESISSLNGLPAEGAVIQSGQELLIPWPTPTPPLVPVALELDGQLYIVDPTGCDRYQIQANDSLVAIGARFDIDFRAIQAANRLDDTNVLRPGDTLCIPSISFSDGDAPPTPGPSPTPTLTPPPVGPSLLYPTAGQIVSDDRLLLQWLAVQDLAPTEWYMVELIDVDEIDAHPRRGFTQDNAFNVPTGWQPADTHLFIWRVRIVRVTGERADGGFEYTYGGAVSEDSLFSWQGTG